MRQTEYFAQVASQLLHVQLQHAKSGIPSKHTNRWLSALARPLFTLVLALPQFSSTIHNVSFNCAVLNSVDVFSVS